MNRTNRILAVLLAVQLVLGVIIFFPRGGQAVVEAGPLLADFDPGAVTGLTITDNNAETLVLAKNDAGEWVLPEYDDYPAVTSRVTSLLTQVAGLTTDRLIAENPTSHARLEVKSDDFQRRLEIQRGDQTDTVYLGSSSGTDATHTRLNDAANVYLTSGLAAWEVAATASSWVDTAYFTAPSADVVRFTVENANGTFEFVKDGAVWQYTGLDEGETFDTNSLTPLLSSAAGLRMIAPLGLAEGDAYGLDDPAATITLVVQEEVTPEADAAAADAASTPAADATPSPTPEPEIVEHTYTLRIGEQVEADGPYAVTSSESDYAVQVAAATVEPFLTLDHDALLILPEAVTPTATLTVPAATPTDAPTEEPTEDVTEEATEAPTDAPTDAPTEAATVEATAAD